MAQNGFEPGILYSPMFFDHLHVNIHRQKSTSLTTSSREPLWALTREYRGDYRHRILHRSRIAPLLFTALQCTALVCLYSQTLLDHLRVTIQRQKLTSLTTSSREPPWALTREYKGEGNGQKKSLKLRRDLNLWVTIVFSNIVGLFACDDPQTKVDIINNFQQRASMSINQRI